MASTIFSQHNFEAVPRDLDTLLEQQTFSESNTKDVNSLFATPSSDVALQALHFAQDNLNQETLSHSLRVYQIGLMMANDHFASWKVNMETYFLACVLHDIATSERIRSQSAMSFEFYGGLLAHRLLTDWDASSKQADAVAEAIIRHQDIDSASNGMITSLGALLQLATLYDNAGKYSGLVSASSYQLIVQAYPRRSWATCFASAISWECENKPWCHTTKIGKDAFRELIFANPLRRYSQTMEKEEK